MKKIYLLFFLLLVSCSTQQNIDVVYIDKGVETSTSFVPKDLTKLLKERSGFKKVEVSKSQFDSIVQGFEPTSHQLSFEREPRFCVVIKKKRIFIDFWHTAFTQNGDSVAVSYETVYLIRKLCGYYNRIEKEDLEIDPDIQKFGMPSNYKYVKPTFKEMMAAGNGTILILQK